MGLSGGGHLREAGGGQLLEKLLLLLELELLLDAHACRGTRTPAKTLHQRGLREGVAVHGLLPARRLL